MSDLKRCPIPRCGGEAVNICTGYGGEMRWGCILCGVYAITRSAWQALPRPSEDAREIAAELEPLALGMEGGNSGARKEAVELRGIIVRLEALAPQPAPVPRYVWVGPCVQSAVYASEAAYLAAHPIPGHTLNRSLYEPKAIPVHGSPTQPAAVPSEVWVSRPDG